MTAATEWRPKVGERVLVTMPRWQKEGTLLADDGTSVPYLVDVDDKETAWFLRERISPLPDAPAPREPWVVLRETVTLMLERGYHRHGDIVMNMLKEAVALEAAAAPKPPTLAEAVRAYLETSVCFRHDDSKYKAMLEALCTAHPTAPVWPGGCLHPNSCSHHRQCMYIRCPHQGRPLPVATAVDDALFNAIVFGIGAVQVTPDGLRSIPVEDLAAPLKPEDAR